MPRAKRFLFDSVGMPRHTLRAIASAPWPALAQLALSFHNSECTLDDLAFLFALPSLERLRLRAPPFANELVRAIVASRLASQLRRVELSECSLDEESHRLLEPFDPYHRY